MIFMWIQWVWLEACLGLEFFAWTTRAVSAPMDHSNSNIMKHDRKSGCLGDVWQKNSLQKSVWHNVWLCVWYKTWVQLCWKSGCMTQKCMTQNVRPKKRGAFNAHNLKIAFSTKMSFTQNIVEVFSNIFTQRVLSLLKSVTVGVSDGGCYLLLKSIS